MRRAKRHRIRHETVCEVLGLKPVIDIIGKNSSNGLDISVGWEKKDMGKELKVKDHVENSRKLGTMK